MVLLKIPFSFNVEQLPEERHFGLRVQGEDKKADSDAVRAAFMPKSAVKPTPNEKIEAEVQAGSSYNVMLKLMPMPTHSPATISSVQKSTKEPLVKKDCLAKTDKLPSPFKMTPKPPD